MVGRWDLTLFDFFQPGFHLAFGYALKNHGSGDRGKKEILFSTLVYGIFWRRLGTLEAIRDYEALNGRV